MTNIIEEARQYYDFILPLVMQAGKIMAKVGKVEVEFKKGEVWDLVTIYDRNIEELLINKIKEHYPNHKYIGEEETESKDAKPILTEDPTWIIDPIDGTANFTRNMPLTGISVGLTINKVQVMGIVYLPLMDELFTAIKGEGAYLNGKRIYTSGCKDIQRSVINYEISIARRNNYYYNLYMFRLARLIRINSGIRSLGSPVVGLCYLACGRTDAYQCDGLYPWDAAAASLILTEAGGHIVDSSGKEFDLMDPNYLGAATEVLAEQYMKVERMADEERMNCAKQK